MRVRRFWQDSSNIIYDYKNSSVENNFLIKFQNFYQKHFLVTLYVILFPLLLVFAKSEKLYKFSDFRGMKNLQKKKLWWNFSDISSLKANFVKIFNEFYENSEILEIFC